MDKFRVIEIKESVFADNNAEAAELRLTLKKKGTLLINLMKIPLFKISYNYTPSREIYP